MSPLQVGYAGLGAMGAAMAQNLASYLSQNSHPPLLIWNRTKSKADELHKEASKETEVVESLREIAKRCDVVFTSIFNDEAAFEVYGEILKSGKEGVIYVDQSTLTPQTVSKLEEQIKATKSSFLSCPIFGQPPAAKAKQLVCILSGPEKDRETVRPMLDALGKKTVDVGDDVTKGAQMKLLGNMTLLASIQVLGEVYTLSDAVGFDPLVIHELFKSFIPAPPLLVYSNKISHGTFGMPGFRIDGGLKDAGHILKMRDDLGHPCPLPALETAYSNLQKMKDSGISDLDWGSLSTITRENAGLTKWINGEEKAKESAPPL